MIAYRFVIGLVVVVCAGGCPAEEGGPTPDSAPPLMFESFTSTTWSLSTIAGQAQLSITDGGGAAACALSEDHKRSLGAAGVQIIMQLPGSVTDTCPIGGYPVTARCQLALGSGAYVPEGCAYFRKWDAAGTTLGIVSAINGEITISGSASSCSIRANVGFLGGSFAETFTLIDGVGVQPWCGE